MTDLNELRGLGELLGKLFSPPGVVVAGPDTQTPSDTFTAVIHISLIVKPLTKGVNIYAILSFFSHDNLK